MTTALDMEIGIFYNACLLRYDCAHIFGQDPIANRSLFEALALASVPGWPRSSAEVLVTMADPNTALRSFLMTSMCSEQCGFSMVRSGNSCVVLQPEEAKGTVFVTILFVMAIVMGVVWIAVYTVKKYPALFTMKTQMVVPTR
jgi:hypothetical protein